jgi:CDP-glucose 4,6-dehydratase
VTVAEPPRWEPTSGLLDAAYRGQRVLVTGHTGFKGAWLTLWLQHLGARVTGYALAPDTDPSPFTLLGLEGLCDHTLGDLRDLSALRDTVRRAAPTHVFHLAAQPLVRRSYLRPLETLETNVQGTAHLLEALRLERARAAVVIVTSDKCYENRETLEGYREDDPVGGHDVYSMSKGAAELVTASWRRSFFPPERLAEHGVAVASARAGNVVGGGDFAEDRLVPDAVRALAGGAPIPVRNPDAVRPWQHVLEPLAGYLLLGARLAGHGVGDPARYCRAWNFGPALGEPRPVRALVESLLRHWGAGAWEDLHRPGAVHEAKLLQLNVDRAREALRWVPRWGFERTVAHTVRWYKTWHQGGSPEVLRALSLEQARGYLRGGEDD